MISGSLIVIALAAVMFAFGRWGQKNADDLSRGHADTAIRRERRRRSVAAGGIAWQVVAVVVLVAGLTVVLTAQ